MLNTLLIIVSRPDSLGIPGREYVMRKTVMKTAGLSFLGMMASVAMPVAAHADDAAPTIGAPPVIAPAMPVMNRAMPPVAQGAIAAAQAQGGYVAPSYGFQLPNQWMADQYFVGNYAAYGLGTPNAGYGWSRYYDDAVLTDQYGRVYDWRGNIDWDHPRANLHDRRGGRDYDRADARRDVRGDDRRGQRAGGDYSADGEWVDGHWENGEWRGTWRGSVRPHWRGGEGRYPGGPMADGRDGRGHWQGGYPAGGYGYGYGYPGTYYVWQPGPDQVTTTSVTTVTPVQQRYVTTYETVSYRTVRAKPRRVIRHRPKPRAQCVCGS